MRLCKTLLWLHFICVLELYGAVKGNAKILVQTVVLPLHMFWVKKIEKLPKVTLYAYLFKPNPPNSAK